MRSRNRPATASEQPTRTLVPAATLALLGVGLQVVNPLLSGDALLAVTIGSVLALAAAAGSHAWSVRGARWAAAMVLTVTGVSFGVEALGVATGFPFGSYAYADTLGPSLLGVPLLVPLAWLMLSYPAFLAGQALLGRRAGWVAAAWTMAAWDLFLDPQMVAAGHWTWAEEGPDIPGVPGIPAVNYLGWLLAASLIMGLLTLLPQPAGLRPGTAPHDAVPAAVLLWTYASQIMGNLLFWDRWSVALVGGVAMGVTVVPYAVALRRQPGGAPAAPPVQRVEERPSG
jgi:uncharacterized membrane protein